MLAFALLSRCKYGFATFDEQTYLTTAYRIFQGDNYLTDEWFVAQLWTFLIQPILWIYFKIYSTTEGIYLVFRYIYTIIMIGSGIALYYGLKKYSAIGAAISSLFYMCYAPFYIMTLCYNTVGIICLVAALILIQKDTLDPVRLVIAGIALAGAVLCCPYLLLLYLIYTIAVILKWKIKRFQDRDNTVYPILNIKSWFWVTVGCGILAILFFFHLLQGGLSDIMISLGYILDNPSYPYRPFYIVLAKWGYYFFSTGGVTTFLLCSAISLTTLYSVFFVKKSEKNDSWVLIITLLLVTGWLLYYIFEDAYINFLMVPINAVPIVILTLTKNQGIKKLFYTFYFPGMIYSVCLHWSSNQNYYAIASASSVALIASVLIIFMYLKEIGFKYAARAYKVSILMVSILISINLSSEVYLRLNRSFDGASNEELVIKLLEGPEKGLIVTKETADEYNQKINELQEVSQEYLLEEDRVCFISSDVWAYLFASKNRCGAYTTVETGRYTEDKKYKIESYYNLYPDKLPEFILADRDFRDLLEIFKQQYEYRIGYTESGNIVLHK